MATRNGKIANLPNDIREQLNLRLLEGETGRELAAWLNALPTVQSILGSQFNGSPISEVNLTHWRQGGYLQWLTERECFDAARSLADGECDLAKIGLSAERLLNVLTVRYGQLLMRWDFSPDESVSPSSAFSEITKKARILQGISRSLLAIHRIQSQSASKISDTTAPSELSRGGAFRQAHGLESLGKVGTLSPSKRQVKRAETAGGGQEKGEAPNSRANPKENAKPHPTIATDIPDQQFPVKGNGRDFSQGAKSAIRKPQSEIPANLSHTPFKPDHNHEEILHAV